MSLVEAYYGNAFRSILRVINPFKKMVIKTEARVHQYINIQALRILKEYEYYKEYTILYKFLNELNRGVVWADQDFKSINHFYHPIKKKGLYGHSNALLLTHKYYEKAIESWNEDDIGCAMFYLGACVHIIQDLTIPQHVNIRLLDNHHQFENYVKTSYNVVKEFTSSEPPIQFEEVEKYARFNAETALRTYSKYKNIENDDDRFHKTTLCALPLAQRTTAGCFLTFLKDINF